MRLREFVGGDPAVVVLLQGLEAHRPEDLFRRAEAGQEPLEVARPGNAAADLVGEHRLCGARRADDENVLGREQRGERAVDQIAALQKRLPELFADLFELVPGCHACLIR